MRVVLLLLAFGLLLVESGSMAKPAHETATSASPPPIEKTPVDPGDSVDPVDFDKQVKPIFESKCMPCHFNGGQMYERLPFDKPATIRQLGHRLLTRIKEDNDRRMIEAFLSQPQ